MASHIRVAFRQACDSARDETKFNLAPEETTHKGKEQRQTTGHGRYNGRKRKAK